MTEYENDHNAQRNMMVNEMKTMTCDTKKILLSAVLLLLMVLAAGIAAADRVYADDSVPNAIGMNPGETYDISSAGINTTITLDKPGNYTIKGQSTHVRIVMKSDGVNLYLENGVNINCGILSNVGSRTPAILVEEVKGTMKIISKPGANVYLEGYMCPAIEKDGTKSRLVFETQDTGNPGTITAQGGVYSAGIGSVVYWIDNTMGNLVFNSGNIVAAGKGGAGIGGSDHCSASKITINGGHIEAHGGHGAAAIGGGEWGSADGITINGGVVDAQCNRTDVDASNPDANEYHDSGEAAIGSGYDGKNGASNI